MARSPYDLWCSVALVLLLSHAACADDGRLDAPRLSMKNGDYYEGQLADGDTPNVLRWHAAIAETPIAFPLNAVASLHYPRSHTPPSVDGFCFQLAGGDVFYGTLEALDSDSIKIKSQRFGELKFPVDHVVRAVRCDEGSGLLYFGPNGLSEWTQEEGDGKWRELAGRLQASGSKKLRHSVELPTQACLELELSWQQLPEFAIELGSFCSLETCGEQLVLVRETSEAADIGMVEKLSKGKGTLRVQLYIDQSTGLCSAVTPEGQLLTEIKIAPESQTKCVFAIQNHKHQLNLDQLIIRSWDGTLPGKLESGETSMHLAGGSIKSAQSPRLDAESGELILAADQGDDSEETEEERIPLQDVLALSFPHRQQPVSAAMCVTLTDGVRVCGDLKQVGDGQLVVFNPSASADLRLPLEEVMSIVGLTTGEQDNSNVITKGRRGRLETSGTLSRGALVEGEDGKPFERLCWHPSNSVDSTQLAADMSGRIVFRDRTARPSTPAPAQARTPSVLGKVLGVFVDPNEKARSEKYEEVMVLRRGDRFPCYIESVDETDVAFRSPLLEITRLPLEEVKAWHSMEESKLEELSEEKRDRLLTLPRMQRKNPPTHLIESKRGDFLRGRLVEMDADHLVMEVRLDNQKIDRHLVGRIVWLEDEAAAEADPPKVHEKDGAQAVQVVHRDGVRLTFTPNGFREDTIYGRSPTLGKCHVELKRVDQLVIGDAIDEAAGEVVSDYWHLRPATDPKFVTDEDSPEGAASSAGTESDLVGKPAPEFELALLDGSKFRLSKQQGKVVVLDFWATWCGPCIQAMPQVEAVVAEFEEEDVELVAVNMQEDAASIRSLLERLEVDPTVALDIDGATAEKYAVTAIPQTVVVDKEGNVAALFVGGGPRLVEQLREVLQREVEK
ncbi:TlpA family protein disulfide reductase [Aeoliella sp.]|uniref:TlpA family protein disulfide reductase n=1 Tax=Aeoliella sp. TaxID=2795800 RepID=UPI003CCC36C3